MSRWTSPKVSRWSGAERRRRREIIVERRASGKLNSSHLNEPDTTIIEVPHDVNYRITRIHFPALEELSNIIILGECSLSVNGLLKCFVEMVSIDNAFGIRRRFVEKDAQAFMECRFGESVEKHTDNGSRWEQDIRTSRMKMICKWNVWIYIESDEREEICQI